MLNSRKKLYVVLTMCIGSVAAATVMTIAALTAGSGAYPMTGRYQIIVSCVVSVAAVSWLSGLLIRLVRQVTAVTRQLSRPNGDVGRISSSGMLAELGRAFGQYRDRIDREKSQLQENVKQMQLQLQLSHAQQLHTEAIIYSIRDVVVVIDEYDKLQMANEAAEAFFGFKLADARHQPIGNILRSDHQAFIDFLVHCRKNKTQASRKELEFAAGDEMQIFDCIVSCALGEQDRNVTGVVAVMHDITREKEISQMKNDFVSHVSHELKTPLASITAYSEMLVDGEAQDDQTRQEFYGVIQSQAQRLNRLIEDILNISRIESGLIKVDKQSASLTILVEEQLKMIRSYAQEKNIEVISPSQIVQEQVLVDVDMISQVIVNLLSNAVKYTPAGGTVTIGTQVDDYAGIVRVTVTDTGVGIPEGDVDHVFDKFFRVKANNKQAKGTGLGLNLVKQIVEKVHGGRVFVQSRVGQGSTFGFELPLATADVAGGAKS